MNTYAESPLTERTEGRSICDGASLCDGVNQHSEIGNDTSILFIPKILLIDDEPVIHEVIESILYREGYELHLASDGITGAEKAKSLQPDVILLDVMLPGMDGYEVCRNLRRSPELAAIPVVMMSALCDRKSRLAGLEAGADEFLEKPIDSLELKIRLRTLTRLNRFRVLKDQRELMNWMVEGMADGVVIQFADGHLHYANEAARHWLFLDAEEELGEERLPELRDRHYRCKGMLEEQQASYEEQWVCPESPTAPEYVLEVRWRYAEMNGQRIKVGLMRDVTEMIAFGRMSMVFQNLVSHKLRTPLNILNGAFQVMQMEIPEVAQCEWGRMAGGAIESLIDLNDSLLRFVDPNLRQNFTGLYEVSKIESCLQRITTQLRLLQTPELRVDSTAMSQALPLNETGVELLLLILISNAMKFHPKGDPRITLSISQSEASDLMIRVCDDGMHLSAKQLKSVARPFFQAEKYFTGNVNGWGLGLSLVKELMDAFSGSFTLANRKDQHGIEATITLPGSPQVQIPSRNCSLPVANLVHAQELLIKW
ncbi:MAG TPA: response regulator [Verrucomicrobiae bacterium]